MTRPRDMYLYMLFAAAQTAAYGAVGIAFVAPSATLGHVRHVGAGMALKAMTPKPPMAAPILLYPNLVMLANVFGGSGDQRLA
ncbi:MAG TPA: hypothetical protein EYM97_01095 [Gemmatimonadetes bacterium]|nr:hypothetical protein [Gemmatimonadota bacterium]